MTGALRRYWLPAATFLAAFAVYLFTLCPTVFVEGSGENIVCAWTLGVPHPPGFPLYCLLAKAFAEAVRVGAVAYRVNLFSAVVGAAGAAGLCLLLAGLGLSRLAAGAAALTLAFSATFWRQSTIAEVYTLSLALVIAQLALLMWWARTRAAPAIRARRKSRATAPTSREAGDRQLLWLALIFGLGLTVHYHHLLLLPAYLSFLLTTDPGLLRRPRTWAKGMLLAALGFSLHLYAPIRSLSNPPIDWGNPERLGNWWRYLTAEQYRGRMFHLPAGQVGRNLWAFLADLPAELSWPGLLAAALGAVVLWRRNRPLFWLALLTILASVAWAVNYDIPWEITVYYLPALLALTIWSAHGFHAAITRVARTRAWPAGALVLVVPALLVMSNFRANDLHRQSFVIRDARNILGAVSRTPRAVLILPETNPTFALLYLTQVEGEGRGLELWSRVEGGVVSTRAAVAPSAEKSVTPELRFVLSRLARGEAVYSVERQPASALPGLAQVTWGSVYRLVPASQASFWQRRAPRPPAPPVPPEAAELRYGAEQRLIASRYLLAWGDWAWERGDRQAADQHYRRAGELGADLPSVAAQLGTRYAEQGRPELAVAIYRQALARQEDAVLHNRLGVVYGRLNRLPEAEQEFRAALRLRPNYADAHANLGAVYGRLGRMEEAVAETERALALDPHHLLALRHLALAYAQMGRTSEARGLANRALQLNPDQEDLRQLLHSF